MRVHIHSINLSHGPTRSTTGSTARARYAAPNPRCGRQPSASLGDLHRKA